MTRDKIEQLKPSTSTVASTVGGALAIVVLWIIEVSISPLLIPAPVAAAITTLVAVGAGYVFSGGRSVDTK